MIPGLLKSCNKLSENEWQLLQINNTVFLMKPQFQQRRIPLVPSASLSRVAEAVEKPISTTFCLPTFVAKGTMPVPLLQVGLRPYSWTMVRRATVHLAFP